MCEYIVLRHWFSARGSTSKPLKGLQKDFKSINYYEYIEII